MKNVDLCTIQEVAFLDFAADYLSLIADVSPTKILFGALDAGSLSPIL